MPDQPREARSAAQRRDDLKHQRRLEALREALVAALNGRAVRPTIAWDVLREWDRMTEADRG